MNLSIALTPNSSLAKNTTYAFLVLYYFQSVEGENHEKAVDLLKAAEGVKTMNNYKYSQFLDVKNPSF